MKNLLVYTNDTTPVTVKTMTSAHVAYEAMRRAWKAGYRAIYTDEAGLEAAKAKLGNKVVSAPAAAPVVQPAVVEDLPVHMVVHTYMRNNQRTIQYKNRELAIKRYMEAKENKDVIDVTAGYRTVTVDFGTGAKYTYLCDKFYKDGQTVTVPTPSGDKTAKVVSWKIRSIKELRAIADKAGHAGQLAEFFKVVE